MLPLSENIDERIGNIKKIINRAQTIHPSKKARNIIVYGMRTIIVIGCLLLIVLALRIFRKVSPDFMIHTLEYSLIVCAIIYFVVSFCIVNLRRGILKLYRRFPSAVYAIWNMDRNDHYAKLSVDEFPSFPKFHNIYYIDDNLQEWTVPLSMNRNDLVALEMEITFINEQLRNICSSKKDEVIQFLKSTFGIRANSKMTYCVSSPSSYRLISIKEILQNSFNSDFARETVLDLIEGDYHKYPSIPQTRTNNIESNEDTVFTFFEPSKNIPSLSGIAYYLIPILLFICSSLYCTAKGRYAYVEHVVTQDIENKKVADAIITKLDIIEGYIQDSMRFERATTVPLHYSINYPKFQHASHIGNIISQGGISYNGVVYSKSKGTFLYTYGTEMTMISESEETDNVPQYNSDKKNISFSKSDLIKPYKENRTVYIWENRGRYAGEGTFVFFNYTFTVVGPERPTDSKILNEMLATYNTSYFYINVKNCVLDQFFDKVKAADAEELLRKRVANYKCVDLYHINIDNEVGAFQQLIEARRTEGF